MVLTEWSLDEAKEVWWEEGRVEGRQEGRVEGREEIIALIEQGASLDEIKRMFNAKPVRRR